jgi:hypothetical protein
MRARLPSIPYESAASKVFSNVSLRSHQRLDSWDFALGSEIIAKLIDFLRNNRDELGDLQFGFELRQTVFPSAKIITANSVVATNSNEPMLITLDQELRVIESRPLDLDPTEAPEMTFSEASEDTVVAQYESKSVVRFYANGFTAGCVSLDAPGRRPAMSAKFSRLAEDYELGVRDHYREEVKYWQGTDHWEERRRRVLRKELGVATTTESIFHRSLTLWLNLHLDADVRSEARTVDSDEPDIFIAAYGGKLFVIEVKWLGHNGTTTYVVPRITKSFGQLRTYLNKETHVHKGTLVIYDGRAKEEFDALRTIDAPEDGCVMIDKCNKAKIHARGSCMVLFLENKTASEQ